MLELVANTVRHMAPNLSNDRVDEIAAKVMTLDTQGMDAHEAAYQRALLAFRLKNLA